jgi:hypothetical protein
LFAQIAVVVVAAAAGLRNSGSFIYPRAGKNFSPFSKKTQKEKSSMSIPMLYWVRPLYSLESFPKSVVALV